jgi:integration host factor subunit alpha
MEMLDINVTERGRESRTVKKEDFRRKICEKLSFLSSAQATSLVDEILQEISKAICAGETVKLHGFGSFSARQKKGRLGWNPQTSEVEFIRARKVVRFHASQRLMELVRENANRQLL